MADRNVRIVDNAGKKPMHVDYPKTTSTLFDKNSLVEIVSGVINPADDNDTVVFGIIKSEVAATDADYATTGRRTVEVIQGGDLVEMAYTGSAPTVGLSYGISNAYTVDTADTSNKVFNVKSVNTATTRCTGTMLTYQGGNAV